MELLCSHLYDGGISEDMIALVTSPQYLQMIALLAVIVILMRVELIQTRLAAITNEALRMVYVLKFFEGKGNGFSCDNLHTGSAMPFEILVPNHLQILEENVLDFLNFLCQ
jgi:hypothetical protein